VRALLIATLLLVFLQSCFHRAGEITLVSESEPLTVKVNPGTEVIDWVWFHGPFRNTLANGPEPPPSKQEKDVIVWQITPSISNQDREFNSPDKHPVITYGLIPEGWEQQLPATGSPPPLLDGYVYTVSAVTFRGPRPKALCVYVNKGRLELYKNYKDPPCDQD
jgi:hypothetical protein